MLWDLQDGIITNPPAKTDAVTSHSSRRSETAPSGQTLVVVVVVVVVVVAWCLTGHLGEPPTPRSAPLRFCTGRRTSLLHVPAQGMIVERSEQRRTSILIKISHSLHGLRDLRSMVAFCKQRLAIFGSSPQPRDPRRGRSTRYA